MEWLILIALGLTASIIGSIMGLGGGIIIVPALLMISGYTGFLQAITPQTAVGTSLLIMIFTGFSSTLIYMKHRLVDYQSAFIFFAGSGPGAIFGVWLNQGIDTNSFLITFGSFIIFVSFVLMMRKYIQPMKQKGVVIKRTVEVEHGEKIEYGFRPINGILIAFVVGICSGLFGIGGGSLMVPAMILLFGFPAHQAIATSMLMIFLSSIVSSISHITLGNVEWMYAIYLIPGALIGGYIGGLINKKLSNNTLVALLRVFLVIIGVRLIYQGIVGF